MKVILASRFIFAVFFLILIKQACAQQPSGNVSFRESKLVIDSQAIANWQTLGNIMIFSSDAKYVAYIIYRKLVQEAGSHCETS